MNSDTRAGFWKRLFLAFIKTFVTIIILAAVIVAVYFGVKELQRSFDSVTTRVDLNRRDIETLQREVSSASAAETAQQGAISGLVERMNGLDEVGDIQQGLIADLAAQQQLLTALEGDIAQAIGSSESALTSSQTATEDTAALGTAIIALQGDLNEAVSSIDALGGEIDAVRTDTEQLSTGLAGVNQSVISTTLSSKGSSEIQQTLALFHVWELMTRARFQLSDNNVGLATADVERAFRAVAAIIENGPEGSDAILGVVQTRLALAFNNLPDNPAVATRDLENAWDALDDILMARVLPGVELTAPTVEVVEPAAVEVAPEATEEAPAVEATPTP